MKRRRHRKKNWDRHFYIQACTYIQTCLTQKCHFTHRFFTAPTLLHTNPFAHTGFYTRTSRHRKIAILPQFLTLEPHFGERVTTSWRLVGTACGLKKKGKEGERLWQRARDRHTEREREKERELERERRCEDAKMWRWEDEKMRRCADVKMWRCKDVKMRRCEDHWRCEDEKRRRCDEDVNIWSWIADLHF